MNGDSWPAAGATRAPRRPPEWMKQLVVPVTVSVLGTLAVTALTPLGESVRELLFPTRAAVSGAVVLEGQPAADARLTLDDGKVVTTGDDGGFLLPKVGNGEHRLHVEAVGAKSRDVPFTLDRGETKLNMGSIALQPLVRLGYLAAVRPPQLAGGGSASSFAADVPYDITLWISGDPAALRRIRSVSYTLPAPLPTAPVRGATIRDKFCYRQAGAVSFQELFVLGGAFAAASAAVDLRDGQPFEISAQPGETRPPNCLPHRAEGEAPEPERTGGGPVTIAPPMPVPTTVPVPLVTIPDVTTMPPDQAQATIESLGFTVQVVRQASAVARDKIIGTQPAAGTKARKGSTVKLLVSTGPRQVSLGCRPSGGSSVNLSISTGTEVLFRNDGTGTTMKVTFDDPAIPGSPGPIDPGASLARTFVDPGRYGYRCYFQVPGEQTGTIEVHAG